MYPSIKQRWLSSSPAGRKKAFDEDDDIVDYVKPTPTEALLLPHDDDDSAIQQPNTPQATIPTPTEQELKEADVEVSYSGEGEKSSNLQFSALFLFLDGNAL